MSTSFDRLGLSDLLLWSAAGANELLGSNQRLRHSILWELSDEEIKWMVKKVQRKFLGGIGQSTWEMDDAQRTVNGVLNGLNRPVEWDFHTLRYSPWFGLLRENVAEFFGNYSRYEEIKILSYNLCNDNRPWVGLARDTHKNWRFGERWEDIRVLLFKVNADVLLLQEARKFMVNGTEIDNVTPIKDYLERKGYTVCIFPYNDTGTGAMCFVTAFRADTFELVNTTRVFISKHPDRATDHTNHKERMAEIRAENYGEEYEKCFMLTRVKHRGTKKEVLFVNTHVGMVREGRMASTGILLKMLEKEECAVIAGDFNSFADNGYNEQMGPLEEKLQKVPIYLADGTLAPTTFVPFPFDGSAKQRDFEAAVFDPSLPKFDDLTLDEKRERITAAFEERCRPDEHEERRPLDHVFVKGVVADQAELVWCPNPLYPDPPECPLKNPVKLHEIIVRSSRNGLPYTPSDHQPIIVEVGLCAWK